MPKHPKNYMKKQQLSTLILDVREHPAVKTVIDRLRRLKQDIQRLNEMVTERQARATEARKTLGRLELDAAMGRDVDAAARQAAIRDLQAAEADLDVVTEEAQRRGGISVDVAAEIGPAIEEAGREATELLDPVLRALTQQYTDGLAMMASAGRDLHEIYGALSHSMQATHRKYGVHQNIRTPHDTPVLAIGTLGYEGVLQVMENHLRTLRAMGYTATQTEESHV
ncbi:MAG: hypothetical protein R2834_02865 [Rhodothermales bacterium]